MTRKQRHALYEGVAILLAGFFGIFAVSSLFSAHDSIALLCGVALFVGWLAWVAFFIYRIGRIISK